MLGVARLIGDPENENAEFAVMVRSDLKGRGVGFLLMSELIAYARKRGLKTALRRRPQGEPHHARNGRPAWFHPNRECLRPTLSISRSISTPSNGNLHRARHIAFVSPRDRL